MPNLRIHRASHARPARGVALVIVLILLLVMTVLGVASIRGTVLEERMSGNMYDRSLAFQAAEAALREGEGLIPAGAVFPAVGCNNGLCATPVAALGTLDRWLDPAFAGWQDAAVNLGALASRPQYIVEDMGLAPNWPGCDRELPVSPNCLSPRYRVTARSTAADRAQVMLQSTLAAP